MGQVSVKALDATTQTLANYFTAGVKSYCANIFSDFVKNGVNFFCFNGFPSNPKLITLLNFLSDSQSIFGYLFPVALLL